MRTDSPYRDLSDAELWERSLRRSRERRAAAAETRGFELPARGASVAALVALTGGPVAGVAAGEVLDGGGSSSTGVGGERPAVERPAGSSSRAAQVDGPLAVGAEARRLVLPKPDAAGVTSGGPPLAAQHARALAPPPPKPKPSPAAAQPEPQAQRRPAAAKRSGQKPAKRTAWPVARPARRGGGVKALQVALGLSADGVFGPATERALERWQKAHGLEPDGVVGPATRRALRLGPGPVLKRRKPARRRGSGGGSGGRSPSVVQRVIAAGNRIAGKPYKWGGGHGSWEDSGYDCSGSVSYALHGGGLLSSPLDSSGFMSYGAPGPGKHITIYANPGHVYMVVDGRRFDTSARRDSGSRWSGSQRGTGGYTVRHPPGL